MKKNTLGTYIAYLLPFELVATIGASGLFQQYFAKYYSVIQIQPLAFLVFLIYILKKTPKIKLSSWIIMLLFLFVGFYEVFFTIAAGSGKIYLANMQLFFGFVFPATLFMYINALSESGKQRFFANFYNGYSVYLIISLVILFVYDNIFFDLLNLYGIGGAIISLRYNIDGSIFSLILGNVNKLSNYLVLLVILWPILVGKSNALNNRKIRKAYFTFVLVSSITLILLFSRLAIIILPFALMLNCKYIIRCGNRNAVLVSLASLLFIILLYVNGSLNILVEYLVQSRYIDGTSSGLLGTLNERFMQLQEIFSRNTSFFSLTNGLGVGGYGETTFGDVNAGSHNLFIDHYVSSGFISTFSLIIIFFNILILSIVRNNLIALIGVLVMFLLAIREFSFAYLYTTSMGGITFVLLIYSCTQCLYLRKSKETLI